MTKPYTIPKDSITVIAIDGTITSYPQEVETPLETVQQFLGGYAGRLYAIESVLPEGVQAYANEDGYLLDLPANKFIVGPIIVHGPIVLLSGKARWI